MPKFRIYHNPRCSKSRMNLELLNQYGIEPDIVEYLHEPISVEDLRIIITALECTPNDIVRKKETDYREAGLSETSTDDEILFAIVEHPKLLERPIVVCGSKARIGRPQENVLQLL